MPRCYSGSPTYARLVMPCRICTANDEDALVEQIAETVWENCVNREGGERWTWADAGMWQDKFRAHVRAMIAAARDRHG